MKSRASTTGLSDPDFSYWPFKDGSSVAVIVCFCVFGFICGVVLSLLVSHLSFFVPREGCASWLWHFLGIFTYKYLYLYVAMHYSV